MDFDAKRILIVGDGISGMGAKYTLKKRGANCIVYNGREPFPKDISYDLIVVSPGIAQENEVFSYARENSVPIIGELELGWQLNGNKPVIAVTGTNGKTTVTELVGSILCKRYKTAVCGNIGISFSSRTDTPDYDVAVVEVSSFQLETIKDFRPRIACITNIKSDHLDRHKTMEKYAALKLKIAQNQTTNDFLVLSQNDIDIRYLHGFSPMSNVFYTSLDSKVKGAYRLNGNLYFINEFICKETDLKIHGDFNVSNALFAVCICKLYGIDTASVSQGLREYETAAHRLKQIAQIGGRIYWDDSKGTNIAASLRACEAMKGDTLVIMGGSDKGYEYDEFFLDIPDTVKEIAVIGQTADKIEKSAFKHGFNAVVRCDSLQNAVKYAAGCNVRNVLLSPASASFDMFKDYVDRGNAFIRAVKELESAE